MEKTVKIGDKDVRMRASALIPRMYRFKFGRDLISDMRQLQKSFLAVQKSKLSKEEQQDAEFSVLDLTIFENVAWLMCRDADNSIPDSPEDWLDSIDGVFSIYSVLPSILELWADSNMTTSEPRKK